ncbi:uncharacterized protein LOC111614382 [Centruroides sculpturatus]|uniref:uncharacterized protein LOC111614382 n=1 Tax=Centruroides sculpturatus TaxID=218467 RepID=UPI000C6E648C|nr:uncharacterized protein LOC111614382 [Centruroides sculpturatus]
MTVKKLINLEWEVKNLSFDQSGTFLAVAGTDVRLCRAYRTTSNATLQVLAGCAPLHLKAKKLTWTWTLKNILITDDGNNKLKKYAEIGILPNLDYTFLKNFVQEEGVTKKTNTYTHPASNNKVEITEVNAEPIPKHLVFKDGSKNNNNVGTAFIHFIHGNSQYRHEAGFKLVSYTTVPEGEIYAIYQAISYIYTLKNYRGHLRICTDSQMALHRINSENSKCYTTNLIQDKLTNLHSFKVSFAWMKGYCGIQGNQAADRLAKQFANSEHNIIYTELTENNIKNLLQETIIQLWQMEWEKGDTGRVTYGFIPNIQHCLKM